MIRIVSLMVLVLFTLLPGCKKGTHLPFGANSLITGLARAVHLEPDTTFLVLEDYFDVVVEIEEITPPTGIDIKPIENKGELMLISNDQLAPLSILTVRSKLQQDYHLLLKKSIKKTIEFTFDPKDSTFETVNLVGDINAWNPSLTPLEYDNGIWKTSLSLNPGLYGYQLVLDGTWTLDAEADTIDNGIGGFNSRLYIQEPDQESLPFIYSHSQDENNITIGSSLSGGYLLAFWENTLIAKDSFFDVTDVRIPKEAKNTKRSVIRIYTYNDHGVGNNLFIPLEYGQVITRVEHLHRSDLQTQIMYFLMVDRFFNGDPSNDQPEEDSLIHPRANFHGGDVQGVLDKLKDGFFEDLGINTIWLSPIPKNPEGSYGFYNEGGVQSTFSAYHGYWPTGLSDIDKRFGTHESLKQLIDIAHESEMNILLDFVAHHIHEKHPLYTQKKDKGWFTDLYLPDGSLNTERWDDHRLTTWFDVFLPTFNFFNPEVNDMLSDTAIYWLYEYGIDGFRHDATKHIHLDFWRVLTKKVKVYRRSTNNQVYQVGETYGTAELIASYVSSGLLDAQFDFNMYDALLSALCQSEGDFGDVKRRLLQSLQYYGHNHLMGNMSGNQDKARFMALATGDISFDEDAKLAGWTRPIEKKTDYGYKKLALMHAINLTIPGIPCIYYGDEIGMTGGNDPDNRRMMRFENWNERERELFDLTATLCRLRRTNLAFMYGDFTLIEADPDILVFSRKYFNNEGLVLINRSNRNVELTLNLDKRHHLAGALPLNSTPYSINQNELTIQLAPLSFEIIYK